jgi:hypothetical protein
MHVQLPCVHKLQIEVKRGPPLDYFQNLELEQLMMLDQCLNYCHH